MSLSPMRRRAGGTGAVMGSISIGLLVACAGGPPPAPRAPSGRPNILLLTLDTLRADHLGAYGSAQARTPVIDALAEGGVLFENAVTPAVMTLPSHASILTGTYPPAHGIRDNGDYRLGDAAITLAEVLRDHGWRTHAVVASFVLDSMFGLDQGFETYDDAMPARRPGETFFPERPAGAVTDSVIRLLGQSDGTPWFIWGHYFDPHYPWNAPSLYRAQFPDDGYRAEIAYLDAEIGRLLDAVRATAPAEETIVVLVADHGEGLGDHGEQTHGVFLYDETTRVPLVLSWPGRLPAGRRVKGVVRTVDLMPTLLDEAGIDPVEAAAPAQGTSLRRLIQDAEGSNSGFPAYSEAMVPLLVFGWSPMTSIRDARYRYIEAPRPELFDLAADPGERSDRAGTLPEVASDYRRRLRALRQEITRADEAAETLSPDPEVEARLRSLGYVGGGGGGDSKRGSGGAAARPDLADPKDRIPVLMRINDLYAAFGAGAYDTVAKEARDLLSDNPENSSVRSYLAEALVWLGRYDQALAEFDEILRRSPRDTEALSNMGWCYISMKRYEDAVRTFEHVIELNPHHLHARVSLGNIALLRGDPPEAERLYEDVLAREPDHLPAILALASLDASSGRPEEAASRYESAVRIDPSNEDAWKSLAGIRLRQKRPEEALEILRRATAQTRQAPHLYGAMGDILLGMGRTKEAQDAYRTALEQDREYAGGWYGLGFIEARHGAPTRAVELLERAVALSPGRAAWHEELAHALARAGRYDEAVAELQRLLDATTGLQPQKRDQIVRAIETYRRQGR